GPPSWLLLLGRVRAGGDDVEHAPDDGSDLAGVDGRVAVDLLAVRAEVAGHVGQEHRAVGVAAPRGPDVEQGPCLVADQVAGSVADAVQVGRWGGSGHRVHRRCSGRADRPNAAPVMAAMATTPDTTAPTTNRAGP